MKKVLLKVTTMMFFTLIVGSVVAQDYCFWVVNNRAEDLYELKVKETHSSSFSADLIPNTTVTRGTPFWIRVNNWSNFNGDLQITRYDSYSGQGIPLIFNVKNVNGYLQDYDYIRLNFRDIHTLVFNYDGTFSVYNTDKFGYGHPCSN